MRDANLTAPAQDFLRRNYVTLTVGRVGAATDTVRQKILYCRENQVGGRSLRLRGCALCVQREPLRGDSEGCQWLRLQALRLFMFSSIKLCAT